MPTITEAYRRLGITRVTLQKWMELAGVKATTHPLDKRFGVITEEDLAKVAELLSQRPGRQPQNAPLRYAPRPPVRRYISERSESPERRAPSESALVATGDVYPDTLRGRARWIVEHTTVKTPATARDWEELRDWDTAEQAIAGIRRRGYELADT